MELKDIVMKLVGPVDAVGDHGIDMARLDNLHNLKTLVSSLLNEIEKAAETKDQYQDSMRRIGKSADKFLNDLGACYSERAAENMEAEA